MSVPFAIARDKTPLLAPIFFSEAPIVIPSCLDISSNLDVILHIKLKIIPILIWGVENYRYALQRIPLGNAAKYTKKGRD